MRKLMMAVCGGAALSCAVPALADEGPKKAEAAVVAPGGSEQIRKWVTPRMRRVVRRIKQRIGDENWTKLKAFWRETIRDRIRAGRGRRKRGFLRFAKHYLRAVHKGNVEQFLAKAKARWEKRPVVGALPK